MALTQTQVSQLYVSIFNRASEGEGNKFWQTSQTTAAAANDMLDSQPAKDYFGTAMDDNKAFIEHIYKNTLNKTYAQDKAGIDYWVSALNAGTSRGEVVASLVAAVADYASSTDPVTKAAYDQFNNRVDVSNYMANTVEKAPADYKTSTAFATSGTTGLVVTNSASTVTTAKTSVDDLKPVDGTTFSLTTGTDDLTGTDKDDLFKAVNSSMISEGTLQAEDKIDGGAGNDTLRVDMKQNFTGLTSGSIKNVENIELTNSSNANLEFAASKIEGATKYVVTDAVDKGTKITDVATLTNIEISGTADTADTTLTVAYAATSTVATGTQTDVQNLKVTNQGSINTKTDGTTNAKFMTVDIDKVETLAITTAGTANSLDLSASADVKTVTVAGEGQTEIKAVGTATTSFDASASTGNVIADLTAAATNALTTVKTGAGDDTVKAFTDDLTANATVSGGTGADTLSFTGGAAKTLQNTITGFETIKVGAISGALTFSGTNVSDVTTITTEGMGAAASFVNMKANAVTVNSIGAEATATDKISVDNAAAVTYNLKAATATTTTGTTADINDGDAEFANATSLVVNVGELVDSTGVITAGSATSATLNVASKVVNNAETTKFNDTLTVNKATTLTVDSKGQLDTAAINAAEATTATITAGSTAVATDVLNLTAAKLNTLNITAKQDFALTGSTLGKVQNMTVDTTKTFTGVALADAANVTVSGTASTAKATFTTLGTATTQTHATNLTATGLKAGLATGDINAGTSSSTINISGVTGNVTLGDITANGGVTLTATNLGGTLAHATGGQVIDIKTTTGKIDVDVSNAAAAVTLGTLTTDGTTGDVTVNASSAIGAVTTGVITGNNVTVNGQSALNAVQIHDGYTAFTGAAAQIVAGATVGANVDIVAKSAVTYTGTNLTNNGVNIGTDASSTSLTATLTGGAKNETISIAGNTKQTGITVTGNLGAGTNNVIVYMASNTASTDATTAQTVNLSGVTGSSKSLTTTNTTLLDTDSNITYTGSAVKDTITLVASNAKTISITDSVTDTVAGEKDALFISGTAGAVTYTNLSVSGIEELTVNTNAASVNASAFSDKTIDATLTTALTLTGTAGNDVIDLSKFKHSAAATNLVIDAKAGNDTIIGTDGTDTIIGGTGADTLTGGTGADVFVFANSDSTKTTMDIIKDYATGVDKIDNGGTIVLAANVDAAGEATVSATGLVTGYNGAANTYDTFDKKLAQIDLALGGTAQQAALFTDSGKTYLYISVGTDTTNDGTDTVIELTGVTATTGITLTAGDITAIA